MATTRGHTNDDANGTGPRPNTVSPRRPNLAPVASRLSPRAPRTLRLLQRAWRAAPFARRCCSELEQQASARNGLRRLPPALARRHAQVPLCVAPRLRVPVPLCASRPPPTVPHAPTPVCLECLTLRRVRAAPVELKKQIPALLKLTNPGSTSVAFKVRARCAPQGASLSPAKALAKHTTEPGVRERALRRPSAHSGEDDQPQEVCGPTQHGRHPPWRRRRGAPPTTGAPSTSR